MTEEEIAREAKGHFSKSHEELAKDIIREANREGTDADDRIKHVLKILALQQVVLNKQGSRIQRLLVCLAVLSVFSALPVIWCLLRGVISCLDSLASH